MSSIGSHAPVDLPATLAGARSASTTPGRLRERAVFYLVMPLLMAVPLGWYGAGIASQMSRPVSLLLWAVICCLSWWISDLCTRLLGRVAVRWRPGRLPLLIGGFCLNIVLARFYSPAVVDAFFRLGWVDSTLMVREFFSIKRDLSDPHYVFSLLNMSIPGLLFWLAGNAAFGRFYGARQHEPMHAPDLRRRPVIGETPLPVDRRDDVGPQVPLGANDRATSAATAPGAEAPAVPTPRFFRRLSRLAHLELDELVAVEAEDHYVLVHSTRGKELVHYRFRDVLEELKDVAGVQVHRSAWVGRQHVTSLDNRGRKLEVVMTTGDRFKVSLSNRGALLQAGLK